MENVIWDNEYLEEVPCCLCDHDTLTQFMAQRHDGLQIVECKRCKLAFVNPRPKKEALKKLYQPAYFNGSLFLSTRIGFPNEYLNHDQQIHQYNLIIALIKEYVGNLGGKKILEIGCGSGKLIHRLKEQGAIVKGIEPVEKMAVHAWENYGLDVQSAYFEDIQFQAETFDLIIALEVIEHVLNPKVFLTKCFDILKKGGFVLISTPNYHAGKSIGSRWTGFQTSFEHLYYFSRESLKALSEKVGFQMAKINFTGLATRFRERKILRIRVFHAFLRACKMKNKFYEWVEKGQVKRGIAHQLWIVLSK